MRIIPVLDLKAGQAVHAIAGHRDRYPPLRSVWDASHDPVSLADAIHHRGGFGELYLADLDAIASQSPALSVYHALSALGLQLWVDAGIRDARDLAPLHAAGVTVTILGLETLRGPEALWACVQGASVCSPLPITRKVLAGQSGLAFSLDLRAGRPLVPTEAAWGTSDPLELAALAVAAGLTRLIVLDLVRVGIREGLGTLPLLAALRAAHPDIELIAGGGVAGPGDIEALEAIGIEAVLIGSSIHDGRLRPTPTGFVWVP